MTNYLLRRLAFAIFTLLLLSMLTFGLVKYAPTDTELVPDISHGEHTVSYRQQVAQITRRAQARHLDLPVFYFALTTADRPDTLDRIFPYTRRESLLQLLDQSGNWSAVQQYEAALFNAEEAVALEVSPEVGLLRVVLSNVRQAQRLEAIHSFAKTAEQLGEQMQVSATCQNSLVTLTQAAQVLQTELHTGKQWIPALQWHGFNNQYHRWASAFLHGDLGRSTFSKRPVWASMRFPLLTTLFINGIALFLAFRIAIPLGIAMARRGGRFDRLNRWVLLLLHSMPGFWLGGLLLLLVGTPFTALHLIDGINLAPYDPNEGPFLWWAAENAEKFILPILTLTLHALALIALQLRGSIREVMTQDFIRTARAKGLDERKIYGYHAFRNSLIPMIALFAGVFPALFAGSIVVEYLFNFPGMGMKTVEAYAHEDYPLLLAILMLGAVLTVIGNLLGDVLYAWADPRVRFEKV